jgi:hypothetical protein
MSADYNADRAELRRQLAEAVRQTWTVGSADARRSRRLGFLRKLEGHRPPS